MSSLGLIMNSPPPSTLAAKSSRRSFDAVGERQSPSPDKSRVKVPSRPVISPSPSSATFELSRQAHGPSSALEDDLRPPQTLTSLVVFQPLASTTRDSLSLSKLDIHDDLESEQSLSDEWSPLRKREDPRLLNELRTNFSYESPPHTRQVHMHRSAYTPSSQMSDPFTPSTGEATSTTFSPTTLYTPQRSSYFKDYGLIGSGRRLAQVAQPPLECLFSTGEEMITADCIGRFLIINNVPRTTSGDQLKQLLKNIAPYKAIIVKHLKVRGWVIITFYDPRDAIKVHERLQVSAVRFSADGPAIHLQCNKIEMEAVRNITGSGSEWNQIWKASESVIKVNLRGSQGVDVEGMEKCLNTIGDLKSFESHDANGKSFTAEYFDTRHAVDAIRILDEQPVEQGFLCVTYQNDDPFRSDAYPLQNNSMNATLLSQKTIQPVFTLGSAACPTGSKGRYSLSGDFSDSQIKNDLTDNVNSFSYRRRIGGDLGRSQKEEPKQYRWPTPIDTSGEWPWSSVSDNHLHEPPHNHTAMGRHMSEPGALKGILNQMDISARLRQRQSHGGHWNPSDRQAIPPENRVFPDRIVTGLDSRTTVMVKDVPNKLCRQELVTILREVVPDEFDFVYLRFDFNNHCNVGYAFVNFTSVKALYQFIQAKVGKKWNLFSSEKVLQVSYANIQGKAALVNKFRNSAVMDVIEEWRPQIFYSSGAMKGKPEPFPEADNPALRNKSINAGMSYLSGTLPRASNIDDTEYCDYEYAALHSRSHGF